MQYVSISLNDDTVRIALHICLFLFAITNMNNSARKYIKHVAFPTELYHALILMNNAVCKYQ